MNAVIRRLLEGIARLPQCIPGERPLLWALLAVNAGGSLYGFAWYAAQLAATPPALWIWTADSPLSTAYFTAVLALWGTGRRFPPLEAMTYFGLVKYGFWTMFVIGLHWLGGGAFSPVDGFLFASHLYMLAQGLLFHRRFPLSPAAAIWATAWFAWDDYLDYLHPGRPTMVPLDHFELVRAVSLASTAVVAAWLWRAATRAAPVQRRP